MRLTVFFPAPGIKRGAALFYLFQRGFLTAREFGGRVVHLPRGRETVKTKQKNYLILWIEITTYDRTN